MDEIEARLDLLTADGLAHRVILGALLGRLSEDERAAILSQCREILDALSVHPAATHRGLRVFQDALDAVEKAIHELPARDEAPRRDPPPSG